MVSDEFAVSGPKHLGKIDWDSDEHRRCVTACLVKGTYLLESDRTNGRLNTSEALAPAWWEAFHFRLHKMLQYDGDAGAAEHECGCLVCGLGAIRRFVYGGVFEYAPPEGARRRASAPVYVVAFRGTMLRDPTAVRDLCLDVGVLLSRQHECRRFRRAREDVRVLLDKIGYGGATGRISDVWLAGHSLGASVALDVGRDLAIGNGCYLPAFLFNAPQVSLAAAGNKLLKPVMEVAQAAGNVVKAALATTVLRSHEEAMEGLFQRLAPWEPHLYVHEKDAICKGFIGYFEQQHGMLAERQCCGRFVRRATEVAMKESFRDMGRCLLMNLYNRNDGQDQQRAQPHLLPSAMLWKNKGGGDSHGLQQWWKPDSELQLSTRRYRYPVSAEHN